MRFAERKQKQHTLKEWITSGFQGWQNFVKNQVEGQLENLRDSNRLSVKPNPSWGEQEICIAYTDTKLC